MDQFMLLLDKWLGIMTLICTVIDVYVIQPKTKRLWFPLSACVFIMLIIARWIDIRSAHGPSVLIAMLLLTLGFVKRPHYRKKKDDDPPRDLRRL